jgi:phospholipid transport system substrate-binding protein
VKKNFFFLIIFTIILSTNPLKDNAYSKEPKQFISEIILEAKEILNSNSDKDTKSKKLKELAMRSVDIKGIAYYTIGDYRKNLDSEMMKKYLKVFKEYFLKSFSSRLTDHSNPKIDIINVRVLNKKYTIVESVLLATSERPQVKIDWRVYTKNIENPLIRDVIIEDLSLARTQKEEFASIIETNNGDISKLFDKLTEFVNK